MYPFILFHESNRLWEKHNKGIGYGGTDEGGWKDPDSRRLSNSGQWDDEEDL
jgi:hypothetical protein